MNRIRLHAAVHAALLFAAACPGAACAQTRAPSDSVTTKPLPPRRAGSGLAVGLEYLLLEPPRAVPEWARAFAATGLPAAKPYPDDIRWDALQSRPGAKLDFDRLDDFVREYQAAGFTEILLALKSQCRWGSKDVGLLKATNATPKPVYWDAYQSYIRGVVERYDGDGRDDMPGLRFPIRHFEIGSELSTYQPEPIEEYLTMLEGAYRAAKEASKEAIVAHAAFLPTTAFNDHPSAGERAYRAAFDAMDPRIAYHGLDSMRAVLDRPDLFDVVNFHALGDPYEIEEIVRWLRWEMEQRGYSKPLLISDTFVTSFIGWGPATVSRGKREAIGVLVRPATEPDRGRLAAYFTRLIDKDEETLAWTRAFVAADMIQRTIVAAEQNVVLMNLAFAFDLPLLTGALARGGAGVTAWAGVVGTSFSQKITDFRPAYHAVRQMMGHFNGYDSIRRLDLEDDRARVYELTRDGRRLWIAWLDPERLVLPGDAVPELKVALDVGKPSAIIEPVITRAGQTQPEGTRVEATGGRIELTLSPVPVWVL